MSPVREKRMEQLVSVVIRGEQYTIRAAEDPSYVREVAAYVDAKLDGVVKRSQSLPPTKAIVLASLDIADELFKAETERERFERLIATKLGTLSELLRAAIGEGASGSHGVDQESEVSGV
ncbi:Cell division protein ZapA [Candidatus Methylomirabilis lanthanidiphila]|uniref:Cell division protein ZapA n=1 Tax=Candidatus Methylomirabilis lanthanidiphila TaxID=2211376 RepID=A0A564ZFZ0_9BACT|nr:Cell division protein ZapA [Candidatus Methylomirabilis lanthanidiphila]